MTEKNPEYISKGVSAPEELWTAIDEAADEMGLNPGGRSRLIRQAVEYYLKFGGNGSRENQETTLVAQA